MIELGDATLLPGFIDAHTHLTMMYREDYTRAALDGLQKTIPEMALDWQRECAGHADGGVYYGA